MIFVPRKNLYVPRRRWSGSRKNQRGSILLATVGISSKVLLSAGNGGTVSAIDGVAPYNTTVGIRFNTDGTVQRGTSINGAGITWVSAGVWISPQARASSDYRVRYTNRVGSDDFTTQAAVEDLFVDLGTQRTWLWNETTAQLSSFDCDFEVEDNVGPLPTASESYTFEIENTS